MDLHEAIYTRRAVRSVTAESVGEPTLRELIDAAVQAPSAVNEQPWSFCVLRDKARLAEISRRAKAHLLASTPAGLLSHHFDAILHDERFDIFYGAPALIVIGAPAASPWAVENCALAAQNLMLTAHARGLGTCWIGFAQQWLRTPAGQAMLDLPPGYCAVAPIIVGHPRTAAPAVARKPADIHWIGA